VPDNVILILRVLAFAFGATLVLRTLISAIRTLLLPRSARDPITAFVFVTLRRLFDLRLKLASSYAQQDRIMAIYAPVGLLLLALVWLILMMLGFTCLYWALGITSVYDGFTLSGSSLLTLGFERYNNALIMALTFSEAALGLTLIALLISYLPTMYGAFSRRETAVTLLEVRAGSPPSAAELISRAYRIRGLDALTELWVQWEQWFADLEESHTSLAALVFFRSPHPERSWVTAAGAVLDAASVYASTVDVPRNPQAELCIRAGYLALRAIATFFRMPYDPDPQPTDPISISHPEYDALYDELAAVGVPLKPDRDQCWRDYAGWRVNYDSVLLALARITVAPYAPWVSDRSLAPTPRRSRFGRRS
jgi:hypothetical protein